MLLSVEWGLVILTAIAFFAELVSKVLTWHFLSPGESREEKHLTNQAKRLRQESKKYESPDTLLEFAKVGREAAKLEAQVESLREEREGRKKSRNGQVASWVVYLLFPIPLAVAWLFWSTWVSDMEPVARVPHSTWIWPMAHALALPNQPPNGSISSLGWMMLSRRVFARLFTVFLN